MAKSKHFVPRHYGWIRQAPDKRDIKLALPKATLPSKVDLTPGMGPFLDQEDLGSCGPNSIAEMIAYAQKAGGKKVVTASRLFIYYNCRLLMGTVNQDSGVDNRTLMKSLSKYGYCPEAMLPYDTSKFTKKPSSACYTAALKNAVKQYRAVGQTLTEMRACLASGRPFLFGFSCYPGLESDTTATTGIVPDPKSGESMIGGHDVTVCGYDDDKKLFKFRNHWSSPSGKPWGDKGYGYISYKYATNPQLAGDFWVIDVAN